MRCADCGTRDNKKTPPISVGGELREFAIRRSDTTNDARYRRWRYANPRKRAEHYALCRLRQGRQRKNTPRSWVVFFSLVTRTGIEPMLQP